MIRLTGAAEMNYWEFMKLRDDEEKLFLHRFFVTFSFG